MELAGDAAARARSIRFLLLDVDGVLTDGRILLLPGHDNDEAKAFHTRDGLGIRLARQAGIDVGLLTGRRSTVVSRRAAELGLTEVHQGARPKLPVFEALRRRLDLPAEAFCYVGDDLVDLPVLERVGLPIAVADADPAVRRQAMAVTSRPGGAGAVREIIEALLRAQGNWDVAVAALLEGETT